MHLSQVYIHPSKWLVEERTRAESAEARCRVKDACLESMLNFVKNLHLNETQRQFVLEQIHKALGTDGKVLTTQNSIAKRALTELATERARADRVEANLVSTQDFRKADIQRINELGIENESLRAACAAMRAAINAKIDDMEPYEYCHKEARWVTVKQALRDYFRNLIASTETRAGEALLKDKARLDWLEARKESIFCLSWNDFDKWTLCNNPTNSSGGANIIAEGPDLRRCLDFAADTQP